MLYDTTTPERQATGLRVDRVQYAFQIDGEDMDIYNTSCNARTNIGIGLQS